MGCGASSLGCGPSSRGSVDLPSPASDPSRNQPSSVQQQQRPRRRAFGRLAGSSSSSSNGNRSGPDGRNGSAPPQPQPQARSQGPPQGRGLRSDRGGGGGATSGGDEDMGEEKAEDEETERGSSAEPPPGGAAVAATRRLRNASGGGAAAAGGGGAGLDVGSLEEQVAAGRSQLHRGYEQLPLGVPLKEWSDLHVRMWLLTLPPSLHHYVDLLCSPGGLLLQWSDELLTEAGISNVFHRKQLLEYVRQLQADIAAARQSPHNHLHPPHPQNGGITAGGRPSAAATDGGSGSPTALSISLPLTPPGPPMLQGGVIPGSVASPTRDTRKPHAGSRRGGGTAGAAGEGSGRGLQGHDSGFAAVGTVADSLRIHSLGSGHEGGGTGAAMAVAVVRKRKKDAAVRARGPGAAAAGGKAGRGGPDSGAGPGSDSEDPDLEAVLGDLDSDLDSEAALGSRTPVRAYSNGGRRRGGKGAGSSGSSGGSNVGGSFSSSGGSDDDPSSGAKAKAKTGTETKQQAGGGRSGGGKEAKGTKRLAEYEQGLLEEGLSDLKSLVRQAGQLCPWPGDAAAELLAGLLDLGEKALVNKRNWQQLNARAVDLLQLIAHNRRLQADTHSYRSIMHRLINTLKGIREYFTDYTNRNWLTRIINVGRDQHMFNQLWSALGALVSDASLGLQVEAAGGQERAVQVLRRLQRRQAHYDDEEARLRQRIEELGGVEALLRDPSRLVAAAAGLGVGSQLTLHKVLEAVGLLEADRSEGVHSLIPHPQLRVLWRQCFAAQQDVGWELWWAGFPAELARVPVEPQVIAALTERLSDPRRRAAFQRRLAGSTPGRLSVVDLRRGAPPDVDLREWVAQLTDRISMELNTTGSVRDSATSAVAVAGGGAVPSGTSPNAMMTAPSGATAAPGAAAAAAVTAAGPPEGPTGATAVATAPSEPYTTLEPRCHLPPLDGDRFVGREDDVRQVTQLLLAGSGSGGGGGGGGGSVSSSGGVGSGPPPTTDGSQVRGPASASEHVASAVCVVAEAGQGKSALAVAAARRLWERGCLPGGCYFVDLRGADCRAELAARFAAALGVAKAEHDAAGGTASVCLALQSLAAQGQLLLLLDGVDCLEDDMYDNSASGTSDGGVCRTPDAAAAAELPVMAGGGDPDSPMRGAGGGAAGAGPGGGGEGGGGANDPQVALAEVLAVAPSTLVLLTSTEAVQLRSRDVELFWLGPLPEPAAVALVQDMARCLTWDEARQLVAACGTNPLALRLAASAVGAGALTLHDAMARARTAAAATAGTTPGASPQGSGPVSAPPGRLDGPSACGHVVERGLLGGGGSALGNVATSFYGPYGPYIRPSCPSLMMMPRTPRLMRSISPAPPPSRCRTPFTPVGGGDGGGAGGDGGPLAYGFVRYHTDGSTTGDGSTPADSPNTATAAGGAGTGADITPSSDATPSLVARHRYRPSNHSFGKSMSFILRTSAGSASALRPSSPGSGGAAAATAAAGSGGGPCLSATVGSASGRTYGSGAAVAAALLSGLAAEPRNVLVQLSILPGVWDEDAAAALLGQPPYTVRALLDVLLGYSLIVFRGCGSRSSYGGGGGGGSGSGGGGGSGTGANGSPGAGPSGGCYSLTPGVLDAARALLADMDTESKVALQCRFVAYVLSQFLRADRLYRQGAVRAAVQLASELRQDVQAMLLVAAKCPHPDLMLWRTLGAARLPALATSSLFAALSLDASAEMEAFWRAVAAHAASEGVRDAAAAALAARALAATLHKQARYPEAEVAWRGALLQCQQLHGRGSLEAAACHSGLGLALAALGRQEAEAEEQHRAALSLRKAALGDRHVDVATSLYDLGRVFRSTGRFREAEEAYKEVLQVRRELLGEDHPAVADTYNSAGIVAGLQKRFQEEEHFYRKALAIRQRTLGPEHPEVAQSLNNVGTALSSQHKHGAAEQVFREALAIKRKVLGPSHPTVGATLNNIARALRYQGFLPQAEAACRQAIAVLEAALGPAHPAVSIAVTNLIYMLKRQGKEDQAAAVYDTYRPRWTPDVQKRGDDAMGLQAAGGGGGEGETAAGAAGGGGGGVGGSSGAGPAACKATDGSAAAPFGRCGVPQGSSSTTPSPAPPAPPPSSAPSSGVGGKTGQGPGPGAGPAPGLSRFAPHAARADPGVARTSKVKAGPGPAAGPSSGSGPGASGSPAAAGAIGAPAGAAPTGAARKRDTPEPGVMANRPGGGASGSVGAWEAGGGTGPAPDPLLSRMDAAAFQTLAEAARLAQRDLQAMGSTLPSFLVPPPSQPQPSGAAASTTTSSSTTAKAGSSKADASASTTRGSAAGAGTARPQASGSALVRAEAVRPAMTPAGTLEGSMLLRASMGGTGSYRVSDSGASLRGSGSGTMTKGDLAAGGGGGGLRTSGGGEGGSGGLLPPRPYTAVAVLPGSPKKTQRG